MPRQSDVHGGFGRDGRVRRSALDFLEFDPTGKVILSASPMWAEIPNSPPMGTPCKLIVTIRNIQGNALTDVFERRHPRTIDGVTTTLPEPTSIPISPVRRRLAGGRHRAHGRQRHAAAY